MVVEAGIKGKAAYRRHTSITGKPFDKVMLRRIRCVMKSNARVWPRTLGAVLALALGGCGRPAAPKSGTQSAATSVETVAVASKPAASAKKEAAERYPLTGQITGIDAARKVLIVYHDDWRWDGVPRLAAFQRLGQPRGLAH